MRFILLFLFVGLFSINLMGQSYQVHWKDLVGVTNNAGVLTKTAPDNWGNGGGNSANLLPANQDGWMEFEITEVNSSYLLGFSINNSDFSYTSTLQGLHIHPSGLLYSMEGGSSVTLGSWHTGDVFRLSRIGSLVKYYRNGVELRSVSVDANLELKVKSAQYSGTSPAVYSSFDQQLFLSSTITPVLVNGSGGGVQVVASEGTAPYSYVWSTGETTSGIQGKSVGQYTITVTDGVGRTATRDYYVGYQIQWKDLTDVSINVGLLAKTTPDGWNNAGANSSNILPARQDGWLEFEITEVNSSYLLGFSINNTDFSYTSTLQGLHIHPSGLLYSMEGGSSVTLGSWHAGDVFRLSRMGSLVKYYRNGVELRSVSVDANLELKVKSAQYSGTSPAVYSSFDQQLFLSSTITPVLVNGSGGGVQVVASEGTAPYSYVWSTGETTSGIQGKSVGQYTITITDGVGRTATRDYYVGYQIQWKDLKDVSINAGLLAKTTPDGWNNAGANSSNILPARQDGWLEFEIMGLNSGYLLGFSINNSDFSYTSTLQGVYIHPSGLLYSMEGGSSVTLGSWHAGDVFRLSRMGSMVKYYRNGVELRSVSVDANLELKVKSAQYSGTSPAVYSSFDQQLFLSSTITPVLVNGSGGGVQVVASEGTAPYSYVWSTGETTSGIQGKSVGQYTITVTDGAGRIATRDYYVGYQVQWKDLKDVSINAGLLAKTTPDGWNNAGANSSNILPARQDGWLEFEIMGLNSGYLLGFSINNSDFSYTSTLQGVYIHPSGLLYSMEGGSSVTLGSWHAGDVFRLSRMGSMVKYYRNGVELRSVSVDANLELKIKSALYSGTSPTVYTSFDQQLFLSSTITPVLVNGSGGGVQVVASEGTAPYSYVWSTGETTSGIQGKAVGQYTITVTDGVGRTATRDYYVGYQVQWKDLTGVVSNAGILTKTVPDGWNNAGANSSYALPANVDGWLEFEIMGLNSGYLLGFSIVNNFDFTSTLQGVYIHPSGLLYSMEGGSSVTLGSWHSGDVFRLSRMGSLVKYYRNGVELRSVSVDANIDLKVKSALYTGSSPAVYASFNFPHTPITILGTVSPASGIVHGGSVQIAVSGGTTPYTYAWSSGETTSSISNKSVGIYTVTVTDVDGYSVTRSYSVGYTVQWKDLTGVTNTAGVLTKTVPNDWGNAGANSSNVLQPYQDGWLEIEINDYAGDLAIGFAHPGDLTPTNLALILDGFEIDRRSPNSTTGLYSSLYSLKSGAEQHLSSLQTGDVLRLERSGDTIRFYQNGIVIKRIATDASQPVMIKSVQYSGAQNVVKASFDFNIDLPLADVTPANAAGKGGSIQLHSITGGVPPYTYRWSSGETTSMIFNKAIGGYSVTITDSEARTISRRYNIGHHVVWKDIMGLSINHEILTKTVPNDWGNAGANSSNILQPHQDGWFETIINDATSAFALGFSRTTDTNPANYGSILYGVEIDRRPTKSSVYLIKSGVGQLIAALGTGDVLRIERLGDTIQFYQNGAVLNRVATDASQSLMIKSVLYSGIQNVVNTSILSASDTTDQNSLDGNIVQWTNLTSVSQSNGLLTKVGSAGWNAGANSTQLLKANEDGWLHYIIKDNTSHYLIGLSSYAAPTATSSINYGLEIDPRSDSLSVWENSTSGVQLSRWHVGDTIKIARAGNQLTYYKNSAIVKVTTLDPSDELYVGAIVYEGPSPAVFVSFNVHLVIQSAVTFLKANGTGGAIAVTTLNGKQPYGYVWSSGETTSSISNKSIGIYSVTSTDVTGIKQTLPYTLGYTTNWADVIGVNTNGNGTFTKSSTSGWNAGANSYNMLAAGQDGWLEFSVNTETSNFIVGFSNSTTDFTTDKVDHGLSIQRGQRIAAWEKSVTGVTLSSWQLGDVLKIARIGSQVKYYRNGIELRSVTTDPSKELRIRLLLYSGTSPVVSSSVDAPLIVKATITPVKSYGLAGSIAAYATSGVPSYIYRWSSGETTSTIANKGIGTYNLTVTDGEGRTASKQYDLGYQTIWKDLTNAANNSGTLTNTSSKGLVGGANSTNVLKANQDGWLQFTADNSVSNISIGFATASGIFNTAAIDYALSVKPGAQVMATESDWTGTGVGDWQIGDVFKIARNGSQVTYYKNGATLKTVTTDPSKEMVIKAVLNSGNVGLVQTSVPSKVLDGDPVDDTKIVNTIPKAIKVTRDGRLPVASSGPPDKVLSLVNPGDTNPVFPGCPDGNYYVGFQLLYDLGDKQTTENWSAFVQLTMFHNEDSLWTKPLHLKMNGQLQTFLSTVFYDTVISCDGNYFYHIDFKNLEGDVPQNNVYLKTLLYRKYDEVFNPSAALTVSCPASGHEREIHWSYAGKGTMEYDVEWVYIENHEKFTPPATTTPADLEKPFKFKEPVRITTPKSSYVHQVYYPTGKVWYRVRAVGYNPQYPTHRIPGNWCYPTCTTIDIANHARDMNWQEQTVFAEEGKYKKVMNYFDGSLRQRQTQTNLSTEAVTLVAESMYDYEGRKAVDILAVPAADNALTFKPAFNIFKATDATVQLNTTDSLQKFHYDNHRLVNSVMDTARGAARYYSPANKQAGVASAYVPDANGYVYSQTEYLNDGTGRVVRQSGVGEKFAMDRDSLHVTRNFYATATSEELIRLFGSNVGVATHYKKNMVVDPNGQVSISYHDQEDRVIATSLAGEKPGNVAALESYTKLDPTPLSIDLSDKNTLDNGANVIVHKLLNVSANADYTFTYDLSALGSRLEHIGCVDCRYDLTITLTDPEGTLIKPALVPGNEATATDGYSYLRRDITSANCATVNANVQFTLRLKDLGDYTITKSLIPHELTFDQMETLVKQNVLVQTKIDSITRYYTARDHSSECDICTTSCPGADSLINEAITEIAALDCENIYKQIVNQFVNNYQKLHPEDENVYQPTDEEIKSHELYCKYQLCVKNEDSDVFEKQIARIPDWDAATSAGYTSVDSLLHFKDPFFYKTGLSGNTGNSRGSMQSKLNNITVATIAGHAYKGTINQVVDPLNTTFFVNSEGNPNPANGQHILYMDIISKRGTMTPAAYDSTLKQQAWTYFKSFYLEAKRKTKLEIAEYKACPAMMKDLALNDSLATLDTSVKIQKWGDAYNAGDSIGVAGISTVFSRIQEECAQNISKADSLTIAVKLAHYFNSSRSNLMRLIFTEDLNTNPYLMAIEAILKNYGCGLEGVTQVNPMSCVKDTTIVIKNPIQTGVLIPNVLGSATDQSQFSSLQQVETLSVNSDVSTTANESQIIIDSVQNSVLAAAETERLSQLQQILSSASDSTTSSHENDSGANLRTLSTLSALSVPSSPPTQKEYDALLAFYAATQGSQWISHYGWETAANDPDKTTRQVYNWSGVTVDYSTGHVIKIVLPSNHLNGTIPDEINDLTELTELDLNSRIYFQNVINIITKFPASLDKLTKLKKLDLYYTGLLANTNTSLSDITNALSNSSDLEFLDLANCGIKGPFTRDIGNFKKLTHLSLSNNSIQGTIPQSIGKLTVLNDLNLSNCQLVNPIPDSLWTITSLTNLFLSANKFSNTIPRDVGKLVNLVDLEMSSNPFNDSIPNVIGKNLRKLQTLYISNAQLKNPIPESLWTLPALQNLDLSYNQLKDSIPHSIGKVETLRYLKLSGNPFNDTIPATIGNLKVLYTLYMSDCKLKKPIPNSLWGLDQVRQLDLSQNPFVNDSIPSAISGLKNLTWLNLNGDSLRGPVPKSIGTLKFLYYADWGNNQLISLPSSLGKLKSLVYLFSNNNKIGDIPDSLGYATNLNFLYLNDNKLADSIPETFGNLRLLRYLYLNNNKLSGRLPKSLGSLTSLNSFYFYNNKITGAIPESIAKLKSLQYFLGYNNLLEQLPDSLGYATSLNYLDLTNNKLRGSIPVSWTSLRFGYVRLGNNSLSGHIPHHVGSYLTAFNIDNNKFTFSDILDVKRSYDSLRNSSRFVYWPQGVVDVSRALTAKVSESVTLIANVDRNTTPACTFQWYKSTNGGYFGTPLNTASVDGHTYDLQNIAEADDGNKYYYVITNVPGAPNLTLYSNFVTLSVIKPLRFTICLEYDSENPTIKKWKVEVDLKKVIDRCIADAKVEDSILTQMAVTKLIEHEVSTFKNTYHSTCLKGVTENLSYRYVPKEYHYTLYYFDQAGNLVQTVPPKGVRVLSHDQVLDFTNKDISSKPEPQHELASRYKFSSLNQVLSQKTPDAGESKFYYNEKSQIRFSQNAQQAIDNNYSYTKYDEQGRITEVGEMNTTAPLATILSHIEERNFPITGLLDLPTFSLSDITKTHYDFGKPSMQQQFPQEFLRTRVAYVEVLQKGDTDTLATYYTYDIHGNVKSLLQHIPGLPDKRTDYVYDLVSGKVNYVMYQYGKRDQFIHRYSYDSDNRITEVYSSTDGFVWDRDAAYTYYKHGPLARVELGEYRVQGLDYYYSLQGWIKGVNMPYAGDPGDDGYHGSVVGRDVFAYNLGYYQGDYKPIGKAITLSENRDQLWTRYNQSMGNDGLFNGNISWMTTDLKKIGQQQASRAKGMQGMVYQYDQLHRIVQSKSLTNYVPAAGFAPHTGVSAYDENYSYDANGNILTLLRHDDKAAIQDDFHYDYYKGTNRLREVKPITRDTTIAKGEVKTFNKVYRNATLTGSAYVPAGSTAEVKALQNIVAEETFEAQNGSDFWAHIVDGPYQYDEIGNLIFDLDKGVKILWTPYGKVREVHTKNDSVVVSYKYDATGNRVEKKIIRLPKDSTNANELTEITRYIHDAGGNVMAIYKDTTMIEQPLYGSSRLGMYRGGRRMGERTLSERNYELSNHLGNVLTVITDNINMIPDSAWASVVSASDYYPFGLAMQGRTFSDTTYRYGFNGKEKDNFGDAVYDYGFRIYNPKIAKFLSVDPLTGSYPWYTPYQFAGNSPIANIDIDGAEPVPGDPNYGRNLIFGNDKTVGLVMPAVRNKGNENWLAYRAKTLDDVKLQMANINSLGIEIENVYIQMHGAGAGINVVNMHEGAETDISDQTDYTMAKMLTDADIGKYLDIQERLQSSQENIVNDAKDDLENGFNKMKLKAIEDIKTIGSRIKDGGTLILGGCRSAYDIDGSNFLAQVNFLLGKRLKVYASEDFVVGSHVSHIKEIEGNVVIKKYDEESFLDYGRSGDRFKDGWKYASPGDDSVIETKKDIILKSKGDPVTPK